MPEVGDKYFHIPIVSKGKFQKGTFRTINITSGVLAVIAKPKGSNKTRIQKFLLSKKKFKTLEKAKAWVRAHIKKKKPKKEIITDEVRIKSIFGTNKLAYNMRIKSFDTKSRMIQLGPSTDDIDAFRERVMPFCLYKMADAINSGRRSVLLLNHDYRQGIGKMMNAQVVDEKRLESDAYISATEEDVFIKVQEGVLNGASIGFRPTKIVDVFYEDKGYVVHEIHDLEYFETSLCYLPINEAAGVIQVYNE